jgi:Protein of unknown function (DUF3667)
MDGRGREGSLTAVSTLAAPACRNCGTPAGGKFCPECGQTTALHPPTAREFLQELVENQVALNGAIWKTLRKLVIPGQLTLEFLAGRRRRYVPPVRLYLTASLIFFLVAKLLMPGDTLEVRVSGSIAGEGPIALQCDAGDSICLKLEKRLREHFTGMTRVQANEFLVQRVTASFPYAMFLLVPLFALLTRVAYWNRPINYGEHLVFALHVHSFVFLLGAIVGPFARPMLLTIPSAIYLAMAMRSVFGGRMWPYIVRFVAVFVAYFLLLMFSIALAFTAAALL